MFKRNPERTASIYRLWEQNCTIDEIERRLRIPRSTVGYYTRKFNRYASRGEPIVVPPLPSRENEVDKVKLARKGAIDKATAINEIWGGMANPDELDLEKLQKRYYFLATLEKYAAIMRDLTPTTEEHEQLDEIIRALLGKPLHSPNKRTEASQPTAPKPMASRFKQRTAISRVEVARRREIHRKNMERLSMRGDLSMRSV